MNNPILWLIMCGPLVLTLCAWGQLLRKRERPRGLTLVAFSVTTANALYAAGLITYYSIHPIPDNVPPWKDSLVLNTALLGLCAPVAGILGFIMLARGGPKWLVIVIELVSFPLFFLGCMAAVSV